MSSSIPTIGNASAMKKFLRILAYLMLGIIVLLAAAAALFAYFLYVPEPEAAQLSGALTKNTMEVGGLKRNYLTYIPKGLPRGAPLVLIMHGSGEGAEQIRSGTGYGFERLADQHGFAVAYPDSKTFDWNDCSTIGEFSVKGVPVDDALFLVALADKLIADIGIDPSRVFAAGVSAGGSMAMRLALEAPTRFRAIAAVAANVPRPENFKCKPTGQGSSVMIMNGTEDPLVPFEGGEVNLLGLFYKAGNVHSSRESGNYFAKINGIAAAPDTRTVQLAHGISVEHTVWGSKSRAEVELVAIHGGGHSIPQPHARRPRLLGPSPMEPNGPEMVWSFFARQAR